jgi:hypothetical protein
MTSTLTWLDFSEAERRRALEVLELFSQRETRDELGLGAIRDAIANAMFPGISTVQRRARYFLFVPWIFQDAERRSTRANGPLRLSAKMERQLIEVLLAGDDSNGVIGALARGGLRQLPTMIYWSGLAAWGIRTRKGTREQWARFAGKQASAGADVTDDGDRAGGAVSWWHDNLYEPPDDFPSQASLELRAGEAQYLRDQIRRHCAGTLLAHLVEQRPWAPTVLPWTVALPTLPKQYQRQLTHAQRFSELMHGAALLYNLMLAERAELDDGSEGVSRYNAELADWAGVVGSAAHGEWDLADFWRRLQELGSRHTPGTRSFVEEWLAHTRRDPTAISASAPARELVVERELRVKGRNARLSYDAARATWQGAAGAGQLTFRWPSAQRQILDIVGSLS